MSAEIPLNEWLARIDGDTRTVVEKLRAIILSSHSELTEHLKWNAPNYSHLGKDRITMNLNPKGGVRVIFHRGAKVSAASGFRFEDPDELARWPAPDRAVISFADHSDVQLKSAGLSSFVRRWIDAVR